MKRSDANLQHAVSNHLDPPSTPDTDALAVRSFGMTDRGRERSANQDQFMVGAVTGALRVHQSSLVQSRVHYAPREGHLFVVADGIGGHVGGEQASALALGTIEEFLLETLSWLFRMPDAEESDALREFRDALRWADARICEEAAQRKELAGMGTTLTMAYGYGSDLFIAHVGDGRLYLMREGRLDLITHDQTLVQQLIDGGVLSPENAVRHPFRHVITNALGGVKDGLQPQVSKVKVAAGDTLLLCTDGLTTMVADDRIAAVLEQVPDPEVACRRLVRMANEAGGDDNITAIVVRYEARMPQSAASRQSMTH